MKIASKSLEIEITQKLMPRIVYVYRTKMKDEERDTDIRIHHPKKSEFRVILMSPKLNYG